MNNVGTDERRFGFFIVDNEAVDNFDLPPLAGWLYIVILRFINQARGDCFPSLPTLAEKSGMSEPTVIKYTALLEEKGLIKVERGTSEQGDPEVNHYHALPVQKTPPKDGGGKADLPGVVNDVKYNNTDSNKIEKPSRTKRAAAESQPKAERPRDPLFDLVAEKSFGFPPGTPGIPGGRVGLITSYLRGTTTKPRANSKPGEFLLLEPSASLDEVRAFYSSLNGFTPPKDVQKFAESFLAWRIKNTRTNETPLNSVTSSQALEAALAERSR